MNLFEQKNAQLLTEFDRYLIENPTVADVIPNGALIAMHVEGDDDFNKWSSRLAQEQADAGQCIIFVNIKKLQPVRSRIEELAIVP